MVSCTFQPLYLQGKTQIQQIFFAFPIHGECPFALQWGEGFYWRSFQSSTNFIQFSSVSTYLLCVLLLSKMKHVGPLSWMCKFFCSMEEEHQETLVWKYNFSVIVFTVYITQEHAMLKSNPHGNCRWRTDTSKPLQETVSTYNIIDLMRSDYCNCLLIWWHCGRKQEFYLIMAPTLFKILCNNDYAWKIL